MGNFDAALRHLLDYLMCPRCGAMNRPGAHLITVLDGKADCSQCAHVWVLSQGDVT